MLPRNRFKFAPGVTIERRPGNAPPASKYDEALENTGADLLNRSTTDAEDALSRDTYEAQAPGDLAITIARLHGLVEGVDMGLLREYLHHITIHHEYDQIQHSGLYQILGVNPQNFGTAEEIQAQLAHQDELVGLEYAKLGLRVLFTNWQRSGKLDTVATLDIYASLFQQCDIITIAIPASWAAQFTTYEQLESWLSEHFPHVNTTQTYRYTAHGEKYILFGNDAFVGDRVRTGAETWEQTGDDNPSSDNTNAQIEPAASDNDEHEQDVYISHAPGDLAAFTKNLFTFRDADPQVHITVRHLCFDPVSDHFMNAGLIEYFGIHTQDLDYGPPVEKTSDVRSRTSANLRHLLSSTHGSGAEKLNLWVGIICQLLAICRDVTTILIPETWMGEKEQFLKAFPNVSEQETQGRNGVAREKILLGQRDLAPERFRMLAKLDLFGTKAPRENAEE